MTTSESRKTKAYSANGRFHYPNATLDLFNNQRAKGDASRAQS